MKQTPFLRIIMAIILGALGMLALLFLPSFWFGLVVTLVIGFALYEFFTMLKLKGIPLFRFFGIVVGVLIPLSIIREFIPTPGWEVFLIISALISVFVLQIFRFDSQNAVIAIATTIFGIIYISWLFSFIIRLRTMDGYDGRWMAFFVVFVTKMADAGAYISGSLFGKHLLIARISPKKTIEGFVGALIFGTLAGISIKGSLPFGIWQTGLLSIVLTVFGQIGDFSESLIKRDCQVKDSGNIFPGLGGVMDIIDSLIFSVPVMYVILKHL